MRRREFIAILTLPFLPGAASAQTAIRRVGFLGANTPQTAGHLAEVFVARLNELGWREGKNLVIVYRWAAGQTAKFKELADELVAERVEVIVTSGTVPTQAARQATRTVPIVMASSANIAGLGVVESLARPGGNVTGLTFAPVDTVGKRLEFLQAVVPGLRTLAALYNADANLEEIVAVRTIAPSLGLTVEEFPFRELRDLDNIAASKTRSEIGGLFVNSDPLVFVNRVAINAFALRERLPTVHRLQEYAVDGGLISYGPHFPDFFRRAADYVDKILKGAKPAELPIEGPTVIRLVINLKTAKALGLEIPPTLLARADEVIE
jgi:putative tryptophan/tyrosine transport system substrate-binding protein